MSLARIAGVLGLLLVPDLLAAAEPSPLGKDDGYRGIWYSNQPQKDEYVYKYSGGLGTYCTSHSPIAIYAKEVNKTFFCYGGTRETGSGAKKGRTLLHIVSYYDHATGAVPRPTILLDKQTDDAHDNPVICIDAKGYIWIFSSAHGIERPAYISVSKKPYDIEDFERVVTTNYSYPQPYHLGKDGFLFLHTKYVKGQRFLFSMTSGDGRKWSEPQQYSAIEMGHYQVSWTDGRKVGTAFNFHPRPQGLNWRTNLYYIETADAGRTWQNAAGKKLTTPLTEVANDALVHDYRAEGLKVYIQDVNFDAAGRPVILFVTSRGYESGPKNGPYTWRTARWSGKEWDIRGTITSDNNYDVGCLHIEGDNLWRIVGPSEPGPQPYNTGGEVVLWTSTDRGATWKKVKQLTHDSPYNHTYCRKPLHAQPDFYALWADGHARKVSDSRLYFCDHDGNVFRLPPKMTGETAKPERLAK